MGFDAGAAIGRWVLDSASWETGSKKIKSSNESMTKSMISAQLIMGALNAAVRAITGAFKDSITKFIEQEKVEAQLNAVLKSTQYAAGLTATEIKKMSSEFQNLTTYGDEVILSAQNILLTFTKIGKDVFPDATSIVLDMSEALGQDLKSSAIQVGKALQDPILGVSALRRVGVNFSEAQQDVIKNLVNTGKSAEAQAMILAELKTEFGGSAAAARDTFGGALKALDNSIGDVQETIGKYIAAAGRPFVESANEMVKGIDGFLRSEEGLKQVTNVLGNLAGFFSVTFAIGKKLFEIIKTATDTVIKSFNDNLGKLVGEGNQTNVMMVILDGAIRMVALGFTVTAKVISYIITIIADLISIIKVTVGVFEKFGSAITDPFNVKKWKEVGSQFVKIGSEIADLVGNATTNIIDIVSTGITGFVDLFNTDLAQKGAKELTDEFAKGFSFIEDAMKKFKDTTEETIKGTVDGFKDISDAGEDSAKELIKISEEWAEQSKQLGETEKETQIRHLQEKADEYKKVAKDQAEVEKWLTAEIEKLNGDTAVEIEKSWSMVFDNLVDELHKSAAEFGTWSEEWKSSLINLLSHIDNLAQSIGSTVLNTMSSINSTFEQASQNELIRLDNEYNSKKAFIEKNVTDETEKEKQLEKLDKKYDKESAKIKEKQFKRNKAFSVAESTINTLLAVTKALTESPPPFNFILASIVAGFGAARTALIAAQEMPAFKSGGIAREGLALVGERGPEIINIGSPSRVVPANDTSRILGSGNMSINVVFSGPVNSDIDIDRVMMIAARKMESKIRGNI